MAKKKSETTKSKSKTTNAVSKATKPVVAKETAEAKAVPAKDVSANVPRKLKLPPSKQDTNKVLRKWHMVAGVVLGLQGLALAFLGNNTTAPVVLHYSALDTLATEANKHDVFGVAARQLFDVPIVYVLSAALLAGAVIYLAAATRFQSKFEAAMDRGVNVVRWLAYAVGGVLLFDAIALLSGITDLVALKLLGAALVGACAAGLAVDLLGPGRPGLSRLLKVTALVSGALPWLALGGLLAATLMYDGNLPAYMYGVYVSGFILSVAIWIATLFRWQQRGRWANTLYSEKMFLLLGLATATALAWQLFAGALL